MPPTIGLVRLSPMAMRALVDGDILRPREKQVSS